MAFFNIRDGHFKQLSNTDKDDSAVVEWLTDHLVLHDDILPEKLLVIGRGKSKKSGSDMSYLLALDKKASLTVIYISAQTPNVQNIGYICEFTWSLRNLSYDELEAIAHKHFNNIGIDIESLTHFHTRHFNIDRPIRQRRFNETQQVILLAPCFDQPAIDSICWHRAEIAIKAFSFSVVEIENEERLLAIQPDIKGGAISSVLSAVGGVPSAFRRNIFRKLGK